MNLDYIRTFRIVAERGSFSRAAEELLISQPAVSLQVRQLERELGCRLFEPDGRKRKLTAAGAVFLKFANQLEALLADTRRQLVQAQAQGREITIGAGPYAAKYILPSLLAAYRCMAPDTVVHVSVLPLNQVSTLLARGQLDLGILVRPFLVDDFATEPLIRERLVLVAPRSHAIARTPHPAPEDIVRYPFVLITPGAEPYQHIHLWASQHGVSIRVIMDANSYDALKEAVIKGIGLSLVPEPVVAEDVQQGKLAVIQTAGLPASRSLYMARRAAAPMPEPVRLLLRTITARGWRSAIPSLRLDGLTGGVPLRYAP